MQRSRFSRWAILWLPDLILSIIIAGCAHHTPISAPPVAATAPPPAPVGAAAPAQQAAFQPYTLLPAPPPIPKIVTPRHRVLHVTRVHEHVYLADSDRHLYEAGRDTQGHIYPIYRDPATHVTYPLYYDSSRDTLYRLARSDNGHFYQNYVGQSADLFYDTDRDYEQISPSDDDRPIVTDSYNTYNYNNYDNGPHDHPRYANYGGYRLYNDNPEYGQNHPYYASNAPLSVHHSSHFNDNWLWAIPVIVGAYLLLHPHHSNPPPVYHRSPTVIVRPNNPVTINNITNRTTINNTVINQATPIGYRPIASPRPVYVSSPGYRPHPGYVLPTVLRSPDVRLHRPLRPIAAVPLGVPAAHSTLVHSTAPPRLPVIVTRPNHSVLPLPMPTVHTSHRPMPVVHRPATVEHRRPRLSIPVQPPPSRPGAVHIPRIPPVVRSAPRPVHRNPVPRSVVRIPVRPRIERPNPPVSSVRQPRRTAPQLEPPHSTVISRPHEPRRVTQPFSPVARPKVSRHQAQPFRPRTQPAPRMERAAPPRPKNVPPRLREVRPHPVSPVPIRPRAAAPKKIDAPKKERASRAGHPEKH